MGQGGLLGDYPVPGDLHVQRKGLDHQPDAILVRKPSDRLTVDGSDFVSDEKLVPPG